MRIQPTLCFITCWLFYYSAIGQTLRTPVVTPYISTAAYSTHHNDVFSFTANQAALARLKNASAAVYAERRFLLAELSSYTAVAGLSSSSGNFGLEANYSGFSDYNESKLGIAYARGLGDKADLGIQFNYHAVKIAGYGQSSAISVELGSIFHLTEKLNAGLHINNPIGGKFGKDQLEKLSSIYTLGLGYEASDKLFIGTAIIKEEGQPVNVNAGIQYKFIPQFMARAGISSATSTFYAGAGLTVSSFRVDVTASYHNQLGITPGLLLLFNFNNKQD